MPPLAAIELSDLALTPCFGLVAQQADEPGPRGKLLAIVGMVLEVTTAD